MIDTNIATYQNELKEEAQLWNKAAKDELKNYPPDYSYYKDTLPYKIYRHPYVVKMLSYINPGDKVLELGSYNGWFTLEIARKGADVDAHDIAGGAIKIARDYYEKTKKKESYKGSIRYYITDLNKPSFPKNKYDVIVIRNVLHHIINLELLFKEMDEALKSGGKILVDDGLPVGKKEAILTGAMLMVLPTDIPYSQKLQRVFKKRNILKRTQDLIDAKDASPFESVTGKESVDYFKKIFKVSRYTMFSAFIGSVSSHIQLPDIIKQGLLKFLNLLDVLLIKSGLSQGTCYFLVAKKEAASGT